MYYDESILSTPCYPSHFARTRDVAVRIPNKNVRSVYRLYHPDFKYVPADFYNFSTVLALPSRLSSSMLHAPPNNSFRVTLQPSSLYIATETIQTDPTSNTDEAAIERNAWHWSFFFTDAAGNITQLQWNVINGESGENFVCGSVAGVYTRTEYSVYVSFNRLSGWRSPGLETLTATLDALYKEHEGKPAALLRAMSPMRSCRTWILEAVATFVTNGWMTVAPIDLEAVIKKESKEAA